MKKADTYQTILSGVSQQKPTARLVGQHYEQVNMIPDPVEGLTRRHGSLFVADKDMALTDEAVQELATSRTFSFRYLGRELMLALPQDGSKNLGTPVIVFDRTSKPIPVVDNFAPWGVMLDTDAVLLDDANITVEPQLDV